MFRPIILAAIYAIGGSAAYASPIQACATSDGGQWTITSYRLDPVSAVTDAQARNYIGQTVVISDGSLTFASTRCEIRKRNVSTEKDRPEFQQQVIYVCAHEVVVPYFYVGASCRIIEAALDGATYVLKRDLDP